MVIKLLRLYLLSPLLVLKFELFQEPYHRCLVLREGLLINWVKLKVAIQWPQHTLLKCREDVLDLPLSLKCVLLYFYLLVYIQLFDLPQMEFFEHSERLHASSRDRVADHFVPLQSQCLVFTREQRLLNCLGSFLVLRRNVNFYDLASLLRALDQTGVGGVKLVVQRHCFWCGI